MMTPQKAEDGFYSCLGFPIKDVDNKSSMDTNNDEGETTPLIGNHGNSSDEPEMMIVLSKASTLRRGANSLTYISADRSANHNHRQEQSQQYATHLLYIPDTIANGPPPWKEKIQRLATIAASLLALVLCVVVFTLGASNVFSPSLTNSSQDVTSQDPPKLFDEFGRYIFEDFDTQTPFSDFLPGLAGIYGKPLWAFFVNRGQAIASFGVESKQTPIMEFAAANIAYQNTPFIGFRTFIQFRRGKNSQDQPATVIEPFSPLTTNYPRASMNTPKENTGFMATPSSFDGHPTNKRILYCGENEIQIQEIDHQSQLETNVTYFILPEEDFGCFVRRTSVSNLHSREPITLSILDGLARIQPAGGDIDIMLKTMGRTLEGFMAVYFPYNNSINLPFFRLTTKPGDFDFVQTQESGHYCVSILESNDQNRILPIVYDTSKIFGEDTSLLRPVMLHEKSVQDIVKSPQYGKAKTSSCFAAIEEITLQPGESVTISSIYGLADHIMDVPVIARRLVQEGFVLYKLTRTREVIRQITKSVETHTSSKLFDAHTSQMFLDNSLRGGIPLVLGDQDDNNGIMTVDEDPSLKVYHVFSRIRGDLERDYNDFLLRSSFFSQGPGDFRDIVQNRRNDVMFQPRIGSFNVRTFLSFIQSDGYEPYLVEAVVFTIDDKTLCDDIASRAVGPADGHRAQREALSGILSNGPFRPGQLFRLMVEQNIFLLVSRQEFIDMVAVAASSTPMAVYEKGFWADHWTYYLDMIETYLTIFPDEEERLMFDVTLPYFFSPASVQPRSLKYVENLSFKGDHDHIQQLDATVDDESKRQYMQQFITEKTGWYSLTAHWQHDESGKVFKSSVYAKLVLLVTLKFSTRDPMGMGIEYEAGRPGFDDANNGLPGMLGSGMPETFELKALIQYVVGVGMSYKREVLLPEELYQLFEDINGNLTTLRDYREPNKRSKDVPCELFTYWDNVSLAREAYREKTKITFTGQTVAVEPNYIIQNLGSWIAEIDKGIARAMAMGTSGKVDDRDDKVIPSYFAYRTTNWKRTGLRNKNGHPLVLPLNMTLRLFPLFLEGPTRQLKSVDAIMAKEIYANVRNSTLYDKALQMYTLSASLADQPIEMGRSVAFAQGWLENQSVWMHMSYKFYLQLLRHKLYEEFFDEVQSGGFLPFMDPKTYGRSPMECSSFIASSAFEDPDVRGRGFLGRLSGSTAEFLSLWSIMFIGPRPFYFDKVTGELRMQLVPTLPAWLFQNHESNDSTHSTPQISFMLFSSVTVRYHNKLQKDLLGLIPKSYKVGLRDGSRFEFNQEFIPMEMADKIRRVVLVDYIEAYF